MFQEAVFLCSFKKYASRRSSLHHLIVEQSRLSEEKRLHLKTSSRCFPAALSGMLSAHVSNASEFTPKPKLRAIVIKHVRSQSPSVRASKASMREHFSFSLSAVRALSQP